jgi:hypothetical protein
MRQGDRLIELLKKSPMTTMEMQDTWISSCPWKRIKECLGKDEELKVVGTLWVNNRPLNKYMVIKKPKTVWVKKFLTID